MSHKIKYGIKQARLSALKDAQQQVERCRSEALLQVPTSKIRVLQKPGKLLGMRYTLVDAFNGMATVAEVRVGVNMRKGVRGIQFFVDVAQNPRYMKGGDHAEDKGQVIRQSGIHKR